MLNKEFGWHLTQQVPLLELTANELQKAWQVLSTWVENKKAVAQVG